MSKADQVFKDNLAEILKKDWEVDNRAKWKDGSPVMTKRILQVCNEYNLEEEFPAMTLRPLAIKSCTDEVLWIYQLMSNNINDLNSDVWNSWADDRGSLGTAYGHQIAKSKGGYNSQIEYVLETIKNNPTSRRIMMNMHNVEDEDQKALIECAYATHFSVENGKLHTTLIQRSNDMITASNWNVAQYAVLTHMIARHCGLTAGKFTHFIQDLHIYNKHENAAHLMMERETFDAPSFWLNPDVENFFEFTRKDVALLNYKKHEQIKIEVAI